MAKSSNTRIDEILSALEDVRRGPADDRILELLRELQRQPAEITSQNEQLQRAQADLEQAARAEQRVKAVLARLVTVQEEERRRLSRNLHDHLGQQMTALRLIIGALKGGAVPPEHVGAQLELLDRIATKIDHDLDTIAWELRPGALDDMGLNAALKTLVAEWSAAHRVPAEFHVSEPDAIRLTADVESHLYRIVQEALNNVAKHAAASQVTVLLHRREHHVIAIVEDNGCGFAAVVEGDTRGRGMGLLGMQERAALVGGAVNVESAPGKGTTLFVRMPVHPAIQRIMNEKSRHRP